MSIRTSIHFYKEKTTMKREVFRPAQTMQLVLIAVITGSVMWASVSALV